MIEEKKRVILWAKWDFHRSRDLEECKILVDFFHFCVVCRRKRGEFVDSDFDFSLHFFFFPGIWAYSQQVSVVVTEKLEDELLVLTDWRPYVLGKRNMWFGATFNIYEKFHENLKCFIFFFIFVAWTSLQWVRFFYTHFSLIR